MLSIRIPADKDGKNLISVLNALMPEVTSPRLFRALRHRDIRINGKRVRQDQPVAAGDLIELYIPESDLAPAKENPPYEIVYTDDKLIIVNKPAGVSVHGDRGRDETGTLIDMLKAEFRSPNLKLCHRLDRNTGGLLLVARDPRTEAAVRTAMANQEIVKRYRCLVRGVPTAGEPVSTIDKSPFFEIKAFLEKDSDKSDVYIHDRRQQYDKPITTRYRVLRVFTNATPDGEAVSELEVELVSGRTHQIRAHFAHIGHPLLGDGKYGRNSFNRQFRGPEGPLTRQQLYAVSLLFSHKLSGILTDYAGKIFTVKAEYDLNPNTLMLTD